MGSQFPGIIKVNVIHILSKTVITGFFPRAFRTEYSRFEMRTEQSARFKRLMDCLEESGWGVHYRGGRGPSIKTT